ncbi:type II toxin-antitoxin system RelE/ParE family toxin [Roseivirga pacifica]|uniref:type II toxin-antitoxin system RelE/ParE family toxin n=1 Tax=Roseivirga pacifica TaxID=1267423 RepID=UPI0020947CA8|nr:type II toxin-antitoxin system RelE/ParE family toxin [Roseivirga pacifica]MCO6357489.1 type II toxin-antitoxin system RelE/ParE family toxin [Roseivirga pacifica]MCO6367746.1 type II toxin-antitoxin system RelE/ParE family toxin [Roseivirga pacifica]MCO6369722.1 type II toxin-antitoxin system RelE/ParE family toxin [Roseivirga pacifica]MCO6373576.1 type II toxin-antitoxin system RelE/ParE family toxin [Roseivirga pacifica]MCO6377119.1 type II toxin-antitoxin system RelE/ParE family toxin [
MKLFWSELAKRQLKEIHAYYKEKAGVKVAKSVKEKLLRKTKVLVENPEIGQVEENLSVKGRGFRYLIEGHHKVVYKVYGSHGVILIAAVFDTRRNPSNLRV